MVGLAIGMGELGMVSVPYLRSASFLAVAGIAIVVTLLLYAEHPRVSRRTVVAMLPWMVVGAALSVLAASAPYPVVVRPVVTGVGAYLTTYILVCVIWFACLQFVRGDRPGDRLPMYVGATGVGATVVVLGSLLLRAGELSGVQLFWLAIAPIAAAAVAGVVLLLLGLWYPEAPAYTGMVGGLVVFGHAFGAIATAVAVVAHGGHTTLSWAVLNLVATTGLAGLAGLDQTLVWAWGYVWVKLVLAIGATVALTAYTRRHPGRGYLVLGLVAAAGIVGGVTALLSMVVGLA